MMKNIGCFEAAWLFIWNIIKNSYVYKILHGIYNMISSAWRKSCIADWFRHLHINDNAIKNSLFGRAVRSPFMFIEFLQRKFGRQLGTAMEKSFFIRLCRTYLENLLALNLRFMGVMMICASPLVIASGDMLAIGVLLLLLGAVFCIFDINFTDYLKNSAIVRLCCRLVGADADFEWYNKEYTTGKARIILAAVAGVASGAVGLLINPLLAPIAAVGIAAVLLVLKRASAGVFFLVFAAPLVPTMAAVGLSLLCIFSIVIHAVITEGFKFKFDGIGFLVLVFIAVYLVAAITSFAPVKSFSIWAIYCVFMAAYFVIINTVNSKKLLNNLLTVFVLSGFLVCLYGIAQYVFGWDTTQAWMDEEMFSDIKMRIYSTLGNPNVLGEYILLVLPVSIGLMWTRKDAAAKVVYAGISAVMFLALILTFSRGCWIGLLFAAAIFITFAAGKLWGLGLIALPILPMVMPESIINRFASIGDMKDSSTSYRVYIWMGTIAMIKDFWVSGIGMGQESFTQVYPFYSYSGIVAPHSHNLFLQILVESGVCGIVIFLLIMFFFIRRMMTGYQFGGKGEELSTIITAISAGICGFLLQGMFDNCFYNYRVMLVFWCLIAMGRACVYVAEQRRQSE